MTACTSPHGVTHNPHGDYIQIHSFEVLPKSMNDQAIDNNRHTMTDHGEGIYGKKKYRKIME